MAAGYDIKYLTRQQLNIDLWNRCIANAGNGLVYAYSFYLDAMATHWDALVLNDYEAVMPLPWRKKWGTWYLYQPFLTAQLGVFGKAMTNDLVTAFLNAVPKKFRYWDVRLNHQNLFATQGFALQQRNNFILPLQSPYEVLYKAYRDNSRRNCKKAMGYGCTFNTGIAIDDIIHLTKIQASDIPASDFSNFSKLFDFLQQKQMAETFGVLSKTGELLASCVFLFSHNRAYYILVGNHPNGRTLGASHLLIDGFIQRHAGQNLTVDFEGSDLRNLAFFYSSFGATEERYPSLIVNRLPWWAAWLKKK